MDVRVDAANPNLTGSNLQSQEDPGTFPETEHPAIDDVRDGVEYFKINSKILTLPFHM